MLSVDNGFHKAASGQVIRPEAQLLVSFSKDYSASVEFFTLDVSQLDSGAMLKPKDDDAVQLWDLYDYADYTDELVSAEWSRSVSFPDSVQYALLDVTLDNTDDLFTAGKGSVLSDDLLPSRPVRLNAGFNGFTPLQQFVGSTSAIPKADDTQHTATVHADDYLKQIAELPLKSLVAMKDARTDEVLLKIVEQYGIQASQCRFDKGLNIIPFVHFGSETKAGEAIRKLVQAENGRMWLDESGVFRFENAETSETDPVMELTDYQIIKLTPSSDNQIVNRVTVQAELRELQEWQIIYEKTSEAKTVSENLWVIPANGEMTQEINLEDPCYNIENPTLGKNSTVSWFTALKSDGTEVTAKVEAELTINTNSATIVFKNSNSFAVEVDEMHLWGTPAKVYDVLTYEARNDDSIKKYGDHSLTITDNEFFQSVDSAKTFADAVVTDNSEPNGVLEAEVKGDFSLQIGDEVTIPSDGVNGTYAGTYEIEGEKWQYRSGYLGCILTLRRNTIEA